MSIREVVKFVYNQRHVYPTSNMADAFLQTAPVTVASNERSFSKLKLRSTVLQDRLESLMLISCEKDFSQNLNLLSVIKKWVQLKNRRVQFSVSEG